MSVTPCAEIAAPIKDPGRSLVERAIHPPAGPGDLAIIKQMIREYFSKLRGCLEGLRGFKSKEEGGCVAVRTLDATTWERCIKHDVRELLRQLPHAVSEMVEELIRNERLDALYFRRRCSDAPGHEGAEEVFSKYVHNDAWDPTRQLGIEGLLRNPTIQAIWPDWLQIDPKIKAMLDEFDESAKVDPNAYALRPLSDDAAIDGLVRILAPLEEDIRARHKDEDERRYRDVLDTLGMLGAMPATGAYWKHVCEAMHDLWPNISYPVIKQAMRQAIRRSLVCTDRGDDFRFSSWVELPETKKGAGPVFSLTPEGRQQARQMGLPIHDEVLATLEITDSFMMARQLAAKWHVNEAALDARLRRARRAKVKKSLQFSDWNQRTTRRRNEPKFFYREKAVYPLIAEMLGRPTA